jgi:hypothetical protein
MTFIKQGFRVSVVSDVRERVQDLCIYKKIKTKLFVAIFSKHVLFSQTSNDD